MMLVFFSFKTTKCKFIAGVANSGVATYKILKDLHAQIVAILAPKDLDSIPSQTRLSSGSLLPEDKKWTVLDKIFK